MLILLLATCFLPVLLGDIMARLILVSPFLSIAFLVIWAALSYILYGAYRKRTVVILSLHAIGFVLLILELVRMLLSAGNWPQSLNLAVQLYFLPVSSLASTVFSRLIYLLLGPVTVFPMYCISTLFMIVTSFLGCQLKRKSLMKSQQK